MTIHAVASDATLILVGHFDSAEAARAVVSELLHAAGCRPQDVQQCRLAKPALGGPERVRQTTSPARRTGGQRPAGDCVAVRAPSAQRNGRLLGIFVRHEARAIEEARGVWRDGRWLDFDPASVPRWLMPPQTRR